MHVGKVADDELETLQHEPGRVNESERGPS